jgi:tetratricopeptide (TPR) repeat protein
MHTQWLEEITYQYASYVYPTSRLGNFGFSLNYVNFGEIQGYDRSNNKTSNPKASDTAFGFTYAKSFRRGLSLGFTSRLIREDLSAASAQTYTLDLGTLYRFPGDQWWSNLSAGLAVRNLGSKPAFISEATPLPLQTDAGLSYTHWNGLVIATIEAHKAQDQNLFYSCGLEATAKRLLSLRAGYRTEKDIRSGLSAGMGVQLMEDSLSFDYAFVPFEDFGNVHRIGLIYRFGGIARSAFRHGLKLMKAGRYAEAILEFDKALAQNPDDRFAARYMRKCRARLKREEQQ